jgi:hypothetical protein
LDEGLLLLFCRFYGFFSSNFNKGDSYDLREEKMEISLNGNSQLIY